MYKKLRAEHGDNHHISHVDLDPSSGEPSANIEGEYFTSDKEEKADDNKPNVGDTSLIDSEAKKEQVDNMLERIGTYDAETEQADDLKKISGVGPVMEDKLHQLGIYTFDQVSRMTKQDYDLLDSIIGEFPGRAERDDWAGQAKTLKNNK